MKSVPGVVVVVAEKDAAAVDRVVVVDDDDDVEDVDSVELEGAPPPARGCDCDGGGPTDDELEEFSSRSCCT